MSKGKHTPGPWVIIPYGDGDSLVIHVEHTERRICFMATTSNVTDDMPRIRADARLIVAATDLLEAAIAEEAAYDARTDCPECDGEGEWEHCGPCSERYGHAIDLRRAAIAKANP